ncbi:MAG: UDP-N-acetylmuramoyl-L-alanine--D-glutamate ligase [Acidaminococcales bacterium]|nr:UDP-N-acetylmuramoyl-L-alanine--D-glutamate ligase [Acidaminococcales bacterium]
MFSGKKAFVFGAGISGVGAAKTLAFEEAGVTLYDEKGIDLADEDKNFLLQNGAVLTNQAPAADFYNSFDVMVLSPGISINHPLAQKAQSNGVEVIGEVELAYRVTKGKIIAITGTNGKTTTATIVAQMVKSLSMPSYLGGNIGQSLSWAARKLKDKKGLLVAEISSFQLESTKTFRPHIAAILNITPDHLDRHGDFAGYAAAKALLFANQTKNDYLILNHDDEQLRLFAQKTKSRVCFFSGRDVLPEGCFVRDGDIVINWRGRENKICRVDEMKIFGRHNVENALAACAAARFANVGVAAMRRILLNFEGVEHRIEYTATIEGVKYYNDSKATNPESAIKALEAFADGQVILIAGGYDKMTDLTEFMRLAKQKTSLLILLGKARERFYEAALRAGIKNIIIAASFEEAVLKAHGQAEEKQVVLLSPACASYDMFKNFEERGRYFKELVRKLQ